MRRYDHEPKPGAYGVCERYGDPATHPGPFEQAKPEDRLGDAPVQADYQKMMTAIMQGIDELLNPDKETKGRATGILIMMFPYGDHSGRCNYMSNGADRRGVVILMKEMIARFEGQPDVTGRA